MRPPRLCRRRPWAGGSICAVLLLAPFGVGAVAACDATAPRLTQRAASAAASLSEREFAFVASAGSIPSEQPVLSAAESLLKTRCMNASGFRFYAGTPDAPPPLFAKISLYSFTGRPPAESADLAARERSGYGLFDATSPAGQLAAAGGPNVQRDAAYIASLTPARRNQYYVTLFGPRTAPQGTVKFGDMVLTYGTEGCQASADAMLYGSVEADERALAVGEYVFGSLANQTDAATHARLAAWSTCLLAATGERFATANAPISYMQRLYAQYGPMPAMHAYERALSTKDGRCQYQSGLAQDYTATFQRLSNRLRASVIRAVAQAEAVDHAAVSRARRFLSHGVQLNALNGAPGSAPPAGSVTPFKQSTTPILIGAPASVRRKP